MFYFYCIQQTYEYPFGSNVYNIVRLHLIGNDLVKIGIKHDDPKTKSAIDYDRHVEFEFVNAEENAAEQIDASTKELLNTEFFQIYEEQREKITRIFFQELTQERLDIFLSEENLSNFKALTNFGFSATDIDLPSYFGGRIINLTIRASELFRVSVLTDLEGVDIEQDDTNLSLLEDFIAAHSETLNTVRVGDRANNSVKRIFESVSKQKTGLRYVQVFQTDKIGNQIKIFKRNQGYEINVSSTYRAKLLTAAQKKECVSLEYYKYDGGLTEFDDEDVNTFLEPISKEFPKINRLLIYVDDTILYNSILGAAKLPIPLNGEFLVLNTTSEDTYDNKNVKFSYVFLGESEGEICIHADANNVGEELSNKWSEKPTIKLEIIGVSIEKIPNKNYLIKALTTTKASNIKIMDDGSVAAYFVENFEGTAIAPIQFPTNVQELKITIKDVLSVDDIGNRLKRLRLPSKTLKLELLRGVGITAKQLTNVWWTSMYGTWTVDSNRKRVLTCDRNRLCELGE